MSALERVRAGGRSLDRRLAAVSGRALLAALRAAGAVSEPEAAALGRPDGGGWARRLRALAAAKGEWTCGVLLTALERLEGPPRPGPFDFYDPQRDAAPAHRSDCPCCRPQEEEEEPRAGEEGPEEEEEPRAGEEGPEEEEEGEPKNEEGNPEDDEGEPQNEDEGPEDEDGGEEGLEDDDGPTFGDEGHEEDDEEPKNDDEGPEEDDGGDEGPEDDDGGGDEGPEDDDGGGGDED